MEQLLVASVILTALFLARSAYRAGLRIYGIAIGITGVLGHRSACVRISVGQLAFSCDLLPADPGQHTGDAIAQARPISA
jgi:hypothetical protein